MILSATPPRCCCCGVVASRKEYALERCTYTGVGAKAQVIDVDVRRPGILLYLDIILLGDGDHWLWRDLSYRIVQWPEEVSSRSVLILRSSAFVIRDCRRVRHTARGEVRSQRQSEARTSRKHHSSRTWVESRWRGRRQDERHRPVRSCWPETGAEKVRSGEVTMGRGGWWVRSGLVWRSSWHVYKIPRALGCF